MAICYDEFDFRIEMVCFLLTLGEGGGKSGKSKLTHSKFVMIKFDFWISKVQSMGKIVFVIRQHTPPFLNTFSINCGFCNY